MRYSITLLVVFSLAISTASGLRLNKKAPAYQPADVHMRMKALFA
jgi:hypothetical protein